MSRRTAQDNPGPLAVIGGGLAQGIGLGSGFAIANNAIKPLVEEAVGKRHHNPSVSGANPMSRKLPPALAFMNKRVSQLHAEGMDMKKAMKVAGKEWQAQKGTQRRSNPQGFYTSPRAPTPAAVPGAKYAPDRHVRFKSDREEGKVLQVAPGAEHSKLWGLWSSRDKPRYQISTLGGVRVASEDALEAANPLRNIPVVILVGLVVWGLVQRQRAQVPAEIPAA